MIFQSPAKIFLSLLLAFILGIFVGPETNFDYWWQGVFAICFLMIIFLLPRRKTIVLSFLGLFFVFGVFYYQWRYQITQDRLLSWERYYEQEVDWQGIIIKEVEPYQNGQKLVVQTRTGRILLFTNFYPQYQYGQELKFFGKVQDAKEVDGFDYKAYLARQKILATMFKPEIEIVGDSGGNFFMKSILSLKRKIKTVIEQIWSRPHSSLVAGLLLGSRETFPDKLTKAMQSTGTTHIVAISGYNITIIARLLSLVLVGYFLKRQHAFWVIIIGIALFVVLTGAQASVVRAGIMGALVLLATQVGRLARINNTLALSAFLMILVNPFILKFDVGFQLSFLATLGLIYLSPIFEKTLKFVTQKFTLRESLSSTLAAQIFVLPILLKNFGRLSLISPLANMLILPVIPITMLLSFLASLAGLFILKVGWVLGFLGWVLLNYVLVVITWLAKLPLASLAITMETSYVLPYYLILFLVIKKLSKRGMLK